MKEMCNYTCTAEQNIVSENAGKILLLFYRDVNHRCLLKEYIRLCARNERNWIAWLKAGVCKLRGIRRKMGKGSCPYLCCKGALLSIAETGK